jgi:hypothetical protein
MTKTEFKAASLPLLLMIPLAALGQRGSGQQNGSSSPPAAASLQGLSYEQVSWTSLTLPPISEDKRAVLCYKLTYGNGTAQPFLLVPVLPDPNPKTPWNMQPSDWKDFYRSYPGALDQITDPEEKKWFKDRAHLEIPWTPCTTIGPQKPLKMGQTLVIAIDATGLDLTRLRILNVNVTTLQGNPINATPVRSSFSNSGTAVTQGSNLYLTEMTDTQLGSVLALDGGKIARLKNTLNVRKPKETKQYFLTWPNILPGDIIPTVSISGIYTPPVSGEAWSKETFYSVGSVVTSTSRNGHYYLALHGGVSSDLEPLFPISVVPSIQDGQILWVDAGPVPAAGAGGGGNSKTPGVWIPGHPYLQGDTIADPYNGHLYTSLTTVPNPQTNPPSPRSDVLPNDPFSLPATAPPDTVKDPNLTWTFSLADSPQACTGPNHLWVSGQMYTATSFVGPYNGKCYKATPPGTAGGGPDPFLLSTPPQTAQPPNQVREGTVTWNWDGQGSALACTPNRPWGQGQPYPAGSIVGPYNGRCYLAGPGGMSGAVPVQPYFPSSQVLTVSDGIAPSAITWQDVGAATPATVTGGQPADQNVSLLNLQLPQAHTLSYYNLSAGVVYSTVHSRTYGVPPTMPGQTGMTLISTDTETLTSDTATVDPVLLLTTYPWPIDAERACGFKCIYKTNPGLSIGLSLASPASSFYAGASFELFRNMQLVLGVNWAKEARLPSPAVQITATTTTAVTRQEFSRGVFYGVTFNVSGFVQRLFGGGGGGGGSSKSSSNSSTQ